MVCYDRTIFGRYTTVTVVQLLLRMCFEPKFTAYFRKTENSLFLIKNTCILCNRKPIKSLSCPITSKLFWNTVITSFSHRNIELDHNSLYKIEQVRVEQALIDVLKVWNFISYETFLRLFAGLVWPSSESDLVFVSRVTAVPQRPSCRFSSHFLHW